MSGRLECLLVGFRACYVVHDRIVRGNLNALVGNQSSCWPSVPKSSKTVDFNTSDRKRVCNLLLIVNSNFDSILPHCKVRYCYRKSSVRPSVCLSVTLRYREHIVWTSSKLITRIISLGSSLLGATTSAI